MADHNNMAMVLTALKNAGLSDNQARILGAEIGRENAFQDKYLWGYHADPKNGAINIGIISWQGNRGRGVEKALRDAGLIQNGKIVKGQASLDVMANYLVNEIRTNPTYAATKKQFLDNPDVDYHTGTKVLGTNFIRWRYNDPKYASGHKNRDRFYAELGGVVAAPAPQVVDSPPVPPMLPVPQTQPAMQPYQEPTNLFAGMATANPLGLLGGLDPLVAVGGTNPLSVVQPLHQTQAVQAMPLFPQIFN